MWRHPSPPRVIVIVSYVSLAQDVKTVRCHGSAAVLFTCLSFFWVVVFHHFNLLSAVVCSMFNPSNPSLFTLDIWWYCKTTAWTLSISRFCLDFDRRSRSFGSTWNSIWPERSGLCWFYTFNILRTIFETCWTQWKLLRHLSIWL